MRTNLITILAVLTITLAHNGTALAYSHANRYGGSTSHSYHSTSHTSHAGAGTYGGARQTNAYGGTTAAAYGAGAAHTTPYGTTAYASTYHPPAVYFGYHPPITVGVFQAGCYNCGYWSIGAAASASGGAARVNAAAANANTETANSGASGDDDDVDVSILFTTAGVTYEMGAVYAVLPAVCISPVVEGATYLLCGNTWFSPAYGANGVYYRVISPP